LLGQSESKQSLSDLDQKHLFYQLTEKKELLDEVANAEKKKKLDPDHVLQERAERYKVIKKTAPNKIEESYDGESP